MYHHYVKPDLFDADVDVVNVLIDFLSITQVDVLLSVLFDCLFLNHVFTLYHCTNFMLNK